MTTGGSAVKAIEILRNEGYEVKHVLSVVDREAGGSDIFFKLGVKFHAFFKISEIRASYQKR